MSRTPCCCPLTALFLELLAGVLYLLPDLLGRALGRVGDLLRALLGFVGRLVDLVFDFVLCICPLLTPRIKTRECPTRRTVLYGQIACRRLNRATVNARKLQPGRHSAVLSRRGSFYAPLAASLRVGWSHRKPRRQNPSAYGQREACATRGGKDSERDPAGDRRIATAAGRSRSYPRHSQLRPATGRRWAGRVRMELRNGSVSSRFESSLEER